MAIEVIDKIKHANGKDPVVDAEDILMPDGKRLSQFSATFPVVAGTEALEPEKLYDFGAVSSLTVTLAQKDDGLAHEYWFQFQPEEDFAGLTIEPAPSWAMDPQYPEGKTCLVGVMMGMAVMAIA